MEACHVYSLSLLMAADCDPVKGVLVHTKCFDANGRLRSLSIKAWAPQHGDGLRWSIADVLSVARYVVLSKGTFVARRIDDFEVHWETWFALLQWSSQESWGRSRHANLQREDEKNSLGRRTLDEHKNANLVLGMGARSPQRGAC